MVVFCFAFAIASQWWSTYESTTDEGLELGKALLVANGFHLYRDIWNDQPPLFTFILAIPEILQIGHVKVSRLIVLLLACLMLGSLFRIVRRQSDDVSAWLALLFLVLCSGLGQLSVSVMAGVPAICLLVVAFDVLGSGRKQTWLHVAIAGLLVGLSLQIKLFTLVAIPAFLLATLLAAEGHSNGRRFAHAAIAGIGIVIAFSFVAWVSALPFMAQAWSPHFGEELRSSYSLPNTARKIWIHMDQDWPLIVLGLAGAASLATHRWRDAAVPCLWLAGATAALLSHAQVWWHHMMLLSVPLAWLTGLSFAWLRDLVPQPNSTRIVTVVSILMITAACISSLRVPGGFTHPRERAAEAAVGAHKTKDTKWILSDRPMDAYRNGLMVPPELVVFSGKRREAGNLTASEVLDSLKRRKPQQVLLRRFEVDEIVKAYLQQHYTKVENTFGFEHYVSAHQ